MAVLLGPWNTPPKALTKPSASYKPLGQATAPALGQSLPIPATTRNGSWHDATFDVSLSPPVASFPPGTELHIIGVYEGALVNGQQEQPWWAKCVGDKSNSATMLDCHQKYAGQHTQKTITVTLSRSSVPKVIALMAYEPVKWKISGADGTNLQKVILAGYHGQDVEGVPAEVAVDVYSNDSSPCQICTRQSGAFYAYEKDSREYTQAVEKLHTITGLRPASFQGSYRSDRFYINGSPQTEQSGRPSSKAKSLTDSISGRVFVDEVVIGNMNLPLPEGSWQGLLYAQSPSNRGSDDLAVLVRIEQNQLAEMIVVRAQFVSDGRGFSRHLACEAKEIHAGSIESNEASGPQACYWVNHDTDPWIQPIFALAANRLAARSINLPTLLVNAGFHKADKHTALTGQYFANPEIKGMSSPNTLWEASPWHPNHVKQFPERAAYIQDRVQWASTWFQIFKATQP
ncbi:hypothetical protein [Methylomonas albis]|nr:hypothetical protein [Methylomonas albis]